MKQGMLEDLPVTFCMLLVLQGLDWWSTSGYLKYVRNTQVMCQIQIAESEIIISLVSTSATATINLAACKMNFNGSS